MAFKLPGFGKKKKKDEADAPAEETTEETSSEESADKPEGEASETPPADAAAPADAGASGGGANTTVQITKLSTDIDRIKASVESFGEVRKSLTERLTGLNEQIGELRAMIMDRDRTIQKLELKAVKAADLVETVQPEKLMIELQKEDAKFEALKANLEGNEAIMDRMMEEVRELRKKLEFFRGIEEVIKLSEEVKKELVDIKKSEAAIHIDSDKVETIYAEFRKKYQQVDLFNDNLQEFKVNLEQNTKDIDILKGKVIGLADKSEVEKLTSKVEKYVSSLKELNKSSSLAKDLTQLRAILDQLK